MRRRGEGWGHAPPHPEKCRCILKVTSTCAQCRGSMSIMEHLSLKFKFLKRYGPGCSKFCDKVDQASFSHLHQKLRSSWHCKGIYKVFKNVDIGIYETYKGVMEKRGPRIKAHKGCFYCPHSVMKPVFTTPALFHSLSSVPYIILHTLQKHSWSSSSL